MFTGDQLMIKINVALGEKSYPILIESSFGTLAKSLKQYLSQDTSKVFIVVDENVEPLYSLEIQDILMQQYDFVQKIVIPAGENHKTLDTVTLIYDKLLDFGADRNCAIAALGGGVTGDMAGFAASTYMRGIKYIQIPTTLLSQADSSVGGKVGVDFKGYKNMIGSFYQPAFVYINVNTLRTLPKSEMMSGLAETIKHSVINDEEFFDYIEYNVNKVYNYDEETLLYIAKRNCSIKSEIVSEDEKEQGKRAILNFGHTFGHAFEKVSGFSISHGHAVVLGMICAFKLSELLGICSAKHTEKFINLIKKAGYETKFLHQHICLHEIIESMKRDKKAKNNRLKFILPKKIGEVFEIFIDDMSVVEKALSFVIP